jgi:hypothetical protein
MTIHTVTLPDQPLLKAIHAPLEPTQTIDKDLQNGTNETKETTQTESPSGNEE